MLAQCFRQEASPQEVPLIRTDSQRVVVTGVGLVTPVGNDTPSSWAAILAGRSGAGPLTRYDHTEFKAHFAAEVKDFDPVQYVGKQDARRMDRVLHFAVAATQEALADANFQMSQWDPKRVGVHIGSGIGGVNILLEQYELLRTRGPRRVSPFTVPGLMLNSSAAYVSIMTGARGPALALSTACATGSHSLGEAAEIIRRGKADAMIAGGTEGAIVGHAAAGFESMGALSTRNDDPQRASRPFDANRDGFVMAEGAGTVILERLDLARARGAHIYGELIGYGANADAFHITAPSEDASGTAECMRLALEDAGLTPSDIDYINAHGTSTPLNDASESRAIKLAFGDYAYKVAVSSTKSMTGHLMGAAGAIEGVFCLLAMRDQILPPTINYETPDPACDLDYVPNRARPAKVDIVMSNSFGFGGHNGTLIFRRLS
jgi:3-oxoacyl-[acyl-carrier-protein] synthase II